MSDDFPAYFSKKTTELNEKMEIFDEDSVFKALKDNGLLEKNIRSLDFIELGFFNEKNEKVIDEIIKDIIKVNFKNVITTFIPGKEFISLSVTGSGCALHCEHCDVKYLNIMKDISNEKKLREILDKLIADNAQGCLISGGCDLQGKVPLLKFIDILKEYHNKSNLIFNYHTGLLDDNEIQQLATIPPDVISFDFTTDEDIIKNVYHLNDKTINDYKKTLNSFINNNLNVIPHITLGLNFGHIKKELEALKYLKSLNKDFGLIVFIVLIPPKNNLNFTNTDVNNISKVFKAARLIFPRTELSLGCMRPRGKLYSQIEVEAIKAGITRIVIPSRNAKKLIDDIGYQVKKFSACCAIPLNLYNTDANASNNNSKSKDNNGGTK